MQLVNPGRGEIRLYEKPKTRVLWFGRSSIKGQASGLATIIMNPCLNQDASRDVGAGSKRKDPYAEAVSE
jgi:L-ascorbate metabolism protein UlaG (beta-lactamase superfamily)